MKVRLLTTAMTLIVFALPLAAQQPDQAQGPALTLQTQPLGKLLDDFKKIVRSVGDEKAVEDVNKGIKEGLGEKGFTGIDMLRPICGYTQLSETAENSGVIILVPITSEADFLDLVKRVKFDVEKVKDSPGLYKLIPKEDAKTKNPPSHLRFKNNHAYLAANIPLDSFQDEKLVAPNQLINPRETAAFAYRVHINRIPVGLKKQGYEMVDQAVEALKGMPGGGTTEVAMKSAGEAFAKLVKRVGDQFLTDGDTAFIRVRLEPQTSEIAIETALSAKKGSGLAKDIAARKPSTNRFAGLINDDAAVGLSLQAPLFAPEIRDVLANSLESLHKDTVKDAPEEYKTAIDEGFKGAIRTMKSGELDIAAALVGPNKDEKFTASLAISFEDPSKLEAAVKELLKTAPPIFRDLAKLDSAKVNGVSVHRMEVGAFVPPEVKPVMGDKVALCVAFAPKGIYLAVGPDADEVIATALKAKPVPAKALDLFLNPKRLQKVVAANDPESGKRFAEAMGTEDKRLSAMSFAIEGGEELRIRFAINMKFLPRAIGASAAVEAPAPKK